MPQQQPQHQPQSFNPLKVGMTTVHSVCIGSLFTLWNRARFAPNSLVKYGLLAGGSAAIGVAQAVARDHLLPLFDSEILRPPPGRSR